jgi:hypothetical protein
LKTREIIFLLIFFEILHLPRSKFYADYEFCTKHQVFCDIWAENLVKKYKINFLPISQIFKQNKRKFSFANFNETIMMKTRKQYFIKNQNMHTFISKNFKKISFCNKKVLLINY